MSVLFDVILKFLSGKQWVFQRDFFIRNQLKTVFPQLFFFDFCLMYCDLWSQYINVRKLFKGGKYSRAETIWGNTVWMMKNCIMAWCFFLFHAGTYVHICIENIHSVFLHITKKWTIFTILCIAVLCYRRSLNLQQNSSTSGACCSS